MKGIVFTEFLEMVEDKFGFEVSDNIVTKSELESNGVYTAVGTYSYLEMFALVEQLSNETKIPIGDLLMVYGEHLFTRFSQAYAAFFKGVDNPLDFLQSIDNYIHVEVLKLYPDAELPKFSAQRLADNKLSMIYSSKRAMSHFAHGLIKGCMNHFECTADVERNTLKEDGTEVEFVITLN